MMPAELPYYAVELEDAAWVAVEIGRHVGASADSPLVARLYEDVRRFALEESTSTPARTGEDPEGGGQPAG